MKNPVLEAALELARLGLSLLPIRRGTKKPTIRTWKNFQQKRPTETLITSWFKGGDEGLALILGPCSQGLAVRDFDEQEAYDRWANDHPKLAQSLPTVATARGRHVYFRCDSEALKRRFGKSIIVMPDGELRAAGAYVLVPPSIHPNGTPYRWLIPLTGLPPLLDVVEAGFVSCNIEDRESLEDREDGETEITEIPKKPRTFTRDVCLNAFNEHDFGPETQEAIRRAILRTIPTGKGQRHRLVFELCRELKAIPALADADPLQLVNILRAWWELAREHSPTPWEEHLADFLEGWNKVKYPKGHEPMAKIFQRATEADLPEVAHQFEQQPLRLLVALCRELQRATKDGPFYLSSRTAGRLLGVDHTTAHRWLIFLKNLRILELTEAGSQNPKDRKASRYRYLPPV